MGTRIRENLLLAGMHLLHALDRRRPDPAELGTPAIRRIMLMSCTAIGDTLLSTPAIRSLRQRYPDAEITLLVNAAYHSLFAHHPDIDRVLDYHGGYRRFFRLAWTLRRARFDLVAIMHANKKVGRGSGERHTTGALLKALNWWHLVRRWNRSKSRQRRRAVLGICRGRGKIRRGENRSPEKRSRRSRSRILVGRERCRHSSNRRKGGGAGDTDRR